MTSTIGAEADRFFNYPFAAVEEALSNAVYHRAYDEREPIDTLGYDPEKLGEYDGDGEITSFTAVYTFDNGGNFVSLCEKTVLSVGGTPEEHSYTVYITDVNSVARVENVVDISSLGN